MQALTERQQQLLRFIEDHVATHGFPPSIREMAEHMGIRSTNGVNDHLKALKRKGFIARDSGPKSRAISLLRRPALFPGTGDETSRAIPILGKVAAGAPILAEENFQGTIQVDPALLPGGNIFALRIKGDSMVGKGIFDSDLVLVRSQNTAVAGQVVVVLLEGEATVKTYRPEKHQVSFEPANPTMRPIVVRREDFRQTDLMGVVIGLYRRFQ